MAEETEVAIIGAGPSGLAVAACLREEGARFVVIEGAREVGSTWRRHYDRLHLHTIKQLSALPFVPFADDVPLYPSRADVVDYLDRYARRFAIEPRFGHTVTSARREGSGWVVSANDLEIRSRALVVATGINRAPKVPELPGRDRYRGVAIHSGDFKNGKAYRGKRALVVGIGNSGGEIALDLWESGAETAISVRSPVHVVPRDLFGLPAQVNSLYGIGRLPVAIADRIALAILDRAVGDLSRYGLRRPEIGPARQVVERGKIPLIDIGTVALVKQGKIAVVPGPESFTEEGVMLSDGREFKADLVVLATGYRAAIDGFLDRAAEVTNDRGLPRFHGTETPSLPGLYFIGYRNPLTGQLHDIAVEAKRVAGQIARKA
jgi:indole-3-pyruvate monooxygenase